VGNQKYISICGEMASDILSLPLFIGLGFNELSMNSYSIPIIKSAMNELSSIECKEIVNTCLDCKRASEIEDILRQFINEKILKAKNLMKYQI
jgi:phosphoenolpyruvate-protein kinase (PTS system EI component)